MIPQGSFPPPPQPPPPTTTTKSKRIPCTAADLEVLTICSYHLVSLIGCIRVKFTQVACLIQLNLSSQLEMFSMGFLRHCPHEAMAAAVIATPLILAVPTPNAGRISEYFCQYHTESTCKGVNRCLKDITQAQQRPVAYSNSHQACV